MKPRVRRVTIAAAVLGAAVVVVLGVVHWGTVRDHVEAWHFQLTEDTQALVPNRNPRWQDEVETVMPTARLPQYLADCSGVAVICEKWERWEEGRVFSPLLVFEGETETVKTYWNIEDVSDWLREHGYYFIEQRFPRRAYVVISEPRISFDLDG